MTLSEFKAWLDGFSSAMGDAPTPEQWATIKAKLATVEVFKAVPFSAASSASTEWIFGRAGIIAHDGTELRYSAS